MNKLITLIMDIGEQMLINGAEVNRVEESVRRMGAAYGATRVDAFIITSNMEVSIYGVDGEIYTQTRRVTELTTNIEKLHRLSNLSRRICRESPSAEEIEEELRKIGQVKTYPAILSVLSYGVISGAFAVFFGGGITEGTCAFAVGLITGLLVKITELGRLNRIFARFLCSFAATLLAFGALKLGLVGTAEHIIIGNIMTLIPGVGLTVALRDLFSGDNITGLLRTAEALLLTLAIVGGYFLTAAISGGAI